MAGSRLMDGPEKYVYVPVWLLVLLVFLASGCVQYALIGAVKLVDRWLKDRDAERVAEQTVERPKVITLDELKRERQA